MPSLRQAGVASLAAVVALSLASRVSGAASSETSVASGDPAKASHSGRSTGPAPHKKPAHGKHKKHRRTVTTLSPRSHLTLAASTDMSARSDSLIDEARLPPITTAHGSNPCPPEMASIDHRFCIDRWEATLVEMSPVGDHPYSPFQVVDGHEVRAVSVPGVFPQAYLSGSQAATACERAGKRLCSPMEWRKACVGPDTQLYGYAESRERGRCNDAGRSPMLAIFGGAALTEASDWDPLKMNDPRLNQLDGSLAKTGAHASCTNDYGVFDMVGNLHEWTNDPDGTFQGGYYLDTSLNGEGCSYRTTAHDFDYHDYSTGFRCCASPR
jgi:sulfatase modifying factor 1